MQAYSIAPSRGVARVRSLAILMLALLFAAPIGALPAAQPVAPRVHPALLDLAASYPGKVVDVIVQSSAKPATVRAAIVGLGGTVTGHLDMIGAVAARISARALLTLGRLDGVRWVSLDAPMIESVCGQCIDVSRLRNAYISTIGADRLWNLSPKYLQGQGVGVAVVDSGINPQSDLYTVMGQNRIVASVRFNTDYNQSGYDGYGHGNHVAGIIGGDGERSNGAYIGVAPSVNLINVKVTDDRGSATMSQVIQGLQWIYQNKSTYNIRVVNLSMNSTVAELYHVNPLDAALEVLWFNQIVVVVSAGNNAGSGVLYPPANDPFVITVGAADDKGTANTGDDTLASFSAYGTTSDGFAKPDLVAPGTNIVSTLGVNNTELYRKYPSHIVDSNYFSMSGTSMAAPVVAAAAALLLQDEPNLTPHQVKHRLKATARPFDTQARAGAGYLDVYAAVQGTTVETANNGIAPSKLAWEWAGGTTQAWNSVNWASVNWASVNWASVNWASVNWASVNWASVNWASVNWASVNWASDYWGN